VRGRENRRLQRPVSQAIASGFEKNEKKRLRVGAFRVRCAACSRWIGRIRGVPENAGRGRGATLIFEKKRTVWEACGLNRSEFASPFPELPGRASKTPKSSVEIGSKKKRTFGLHGGFVPLQWPALFELGSLRRKGSARVRKRFRSPLRRHDL